MVISEPESYEDMEVNFFIKAKLIDVTAYTWTGRLYTENTPMIYDVITAEIIEIGRLIVPNESPVIDFSDWWYPRVLNVRFYIY